MRPARSEASTAPRAEVSPDARITDAAIVRVAQAACHPFLQSADEDPAIPEGQVGD